MSQPESSHLADFHTLGEDPIPAVVIELAAGQPVELVWRNELGGLTFRAGDSYIKYNPSQTGIDLERERVRLDWIAGRLTAPQVRSFGADSIPQWMVTEALAGDCAVGDTWRARRSEAIDAIATGLRSIHAIPTDGFRQSGFLSPGSEECRTRLVPDRQSTDRSSSTATHALPTP